MGEKIAKLKQDLVEVKGAVQDLRENFENVDNSCNDDVFDNLISCMQEKIEILEEDLKNHLETTENFICDVK